MVAVAKQPHIWNDEPVQVQRGDVWQLGKHRLYCGDSTNAEDVSRLMQGDKADLIFADPPYGIGIDAWDTAIEDVIGFIDLITSHLKHGGFFAFTHQMPYMVDWLYALKHSRLKYKDHIAWVKRVHTSPTSPLVRGHESVFIYSYGVTNYYMTKGLYSDIKVPGLLHDLITIEGIQTYINHLHLKLNGKNKPQQDNGQKHTTYAYLLKAGDRSPEYANFSNVWSFLPEHHSKMKFRHNHATVKPILLMNRLLELCTPENALVYDAFLGSGTTLISAENTNRTCYGMELSETYCASIIERWQNVTGQHGYRVEVAR